MSMELRGTTICAVRKIAATPRLQAMVRSQWAERSCPQGLLFFDGGQVVIGLRALWRTRLPCSFEEKVTQVPGRQP